MMTKNRNNDGLQMRSRRTPPRFFVVLAAFFFLHAVTDCTPRALLSERMGSSNERTRRTAFNEFDELDAASKKKYLGIMRGMLFDKNPDIRLHAADSLGRMGPAAEEAVPDLIQVISEGNGTLRVRAINALAGIGAASVPALTPVLNHQDSATRCAAADALGSIGAGATEAIPALVVLLSERNREVAQHAASALGFIGPAAVPALLQVAGRGDSYATEMAGTAFSHLKADADVVHELDRVLRNPGEAPGMRGFAAKALGNMREKAAEAIPDLVLSLHDENEEVRSAARWALGQIGPAAVPSLQESLKSNDPRVRAGAASALGSMGPSAKDAAPALLQAMKDGDRTVRIETISALEKMRVTSRAAVQALIQTLDADADEIVRLNAAHALKRIGTSEANEAVLRYNKKNSLR